MRISILTFGTRGDIDPYIAIALELKSRGHEVTIVAPINFIPYISQYGLSSRPLDIDMKELCSKDEIANARIYAKGSLVSQDEHNPARIIHASAFSLCADAGGIISNTTTLAASEYISEKLNIPHITTHFYPVGETGHRASVLGKNKSFKFLNRLSRKYGV